MPAYPEFSIVQQGQATTYATDPLAWFCRRCSASRVCCLRSLTAGEVPSTPRRHTAITLLVCSLQKLQHAGLSVHNLANKQPCLCYHLLALGQ